MKSSDHILKGEQAYANGQYEAAVEHFKKALEKLEALGKKNEALAMTINNLAAAYRALGQHEEAEPYLKGCVPICEDVYGLSHPDLAIAINNLAALYYDQGRSTEAEALYLRALPMVDHNPKHQPYYDTVLKGLLKVYQEQDNQPRVKYVSSLLKQPVQ